MIHRLKITDPENCACPWWSKVDWLKDQTKIRFTPGLNILLGPNGSGKSTILTLIARLLCCEQGDQQLVGQNTFMDQIYKNGKLKSGVVPVHGGEPIMHFDPSKTVGLCGGSFDYDFTTQGVQNAMMKASSGQTAIIRMERVLQAVFKEKWPEIQWKRPKEKYPELDAMLKGTEKPTVPTVLFDEPDRSLDLRSEIVFFGKLAELKNVQVILATHSPYALHLPGANYIETNPGYALQTRVETEVHFVQAVRQDPGRLERILRVLETLKEHKDPPK